MSGWLARAFLVEAIAEDALGDDGDAHRALERALDHAEPDGALLPFLLHPVPGLLERHSLSHPFVFAAGDGAAVPGPHRPTVPMPPPPSVPPPARTRPPT